MINRTAPQTQSIFGFMGRAVLENRLETNLAFLDQRLSNGSSESELMEVVKETYLNLTLDHLYWDDQATVPIFGLFMAHAR